MSSMKQLLESLQHIEEGGRDQEVQPLDPKVYPPLKINDIDNSPQGKGRQILSALVDGSGNVVRSRYGDIWNVKYGPMPATITRSVQPAVVQPSAEPAQAQPAQAQPAQAQPAQGDFGSFGSIEKVRLSLDGVKKLTGLQETLLFKSIIGRALLETTIILKESDLDQVNKFWPDLVKWASNPANANFPEAKEIERLKEPITKWQASQQQSTITGNSSSVRDNANASAQPAAVTGSAALNPANGSADTTIASGPETAAGGAGIVPPPDKKTIPDAAAVAAAGNHPEKGTDAQSYAAVNRTTGAMYNNDTIGPGSKDTGTDHRVAELQKRLGITPATGVYGDAEKKAVSALQQKYGITVDGKYGPDTKAAFEKSYDKSGTGNKPEKKIDQLKASPDAGLKANYSSDELKAAEEALKDPNVSARDKEYYKNLLAAQKEKTGASSTDTTVQPDANSARPGLDPKGKPDVYDRQKQLADLGATNKDGTKLKTDGVRGNDTIKAEKEFGYLIIDPKTKITVNGTTRPVNPADIKNIPTWIKAVKEKRRKIEEVPLVYMDIVKKQLSIKESYNTTGQMYNEDQTLARIIQLSR